jgi:hypothetical protein
MPAPRLNMRKLAPKSVRQKANKINYLAKSVHERRQILSLFAIRGMAAIVVMQQFQPFARIS